MSGNFPSATDVVITSEKFKDFLVKGDPNLKIRQWWIGATICRGFLHNTPGLCPCGCFARLWLDFMALFPPGLFIKACCYYCWFYEQPLIRFAIDFGNVESVRLLVDRGVDLEKKSINPKTVQDATCFNVQPVTPLEYIKQQTCFGGCCIKPEIIKLVTPKPRKVKVEDTDCCAELPVEGELKDSDK